MQVLTNKPMTIDELVNFTGKDSIYQSANLGKIRILNTSGGQTIEVDNIAIIKGKKFGLRKRKNINNTEYDYIGILIV